VLGVEGAGGALARLSDRRGLDEAVYERLLAAIGQAVVVTDPAGTIVYWNRAAEEMYGWTAREAVGRDVDELLPRADGHMQSSLIVDQRAAGRAWSGEVAVRRKDGSVFPALVSSSPLLDEAGGATHLVGVSSDLSERAAVERRFRTGFEVSPSGWAYTDLEGRFTLVNDAFCAILGRTRDEILGHHPDEFTSPDDLPARATPFAEMLAVSMRTFRTRKRYVTKTGDERWVDVEVHLVQDDNGRPEYFFGHVQNVTGWLRSQADLANAKDRYEHLFQEVVRAVAASHELVDLFTHGHQQRVARLATEIARRLELDDDTCQGIAVGAALHDIGKVATPAQILTKPARLNDAEYALVKQHARDGYNILANIDFPWPVPIMILEHHERLDGSGYPSGLAGDAIHLESQVVAVADTVETIASHRPYQPARPIETALKIIQDQRGLLFRDDVVDACASAFREGYLLNAEA